MVSSDVDLFISLCYHYFDKSDFSEDRIFVSMEYWNHNTAYYEWIKTEAASCRSVLDIGCGDGALISYLDDGSKNLLGIDNEQSCIDIANRQHRTGNATFLCLGFEDFDTDRKYDAVTFVASLHHMNMKSAIEKATSYLEDDGVLLIVGLAKPSNAFDYIIEGMRIIPSSVISRIKHIKSSESKSIPVSYDFQSMNEVRETANTLLPGYTLKYGLFYRYLLKWTKRQT